MNYLWFGLMIPAYSLGFVLAAFLAVIFLAEGRHQDLQVAIPVLVVCFAYFAFGYVVFSVVPAWMKRRLHLKVTPFKDDGFFPVWEQESLALTSYIGIDRDDGRILMADIFGHQHLLAIRDVSSWEVIFSGKRPFLYVYTRVSSLPSFSMQLGRSKAQWCIANMRQLIG